VNRDHVICNPSYQHKGQLDIDCLCGVHITAFSGPDLEDQWLAHRRAVGARSRGLHDLNGGSQRFVFSMKARLAGFEEAAL